MPRFSKETAAFPATQPTGDSSRERILFALSDKERAAFFPSRNKELVNLDQHSWINPGLFQDHDDWTRHLKDVRPTLLVSCWSTPPLPAALLFTDALPLRYVCHVTGSVRNAVPREFLAGGGIVTNWGSLVGPTVAEHALLLILATLRGMPRWEKIRRTISGGDAIALLQTQSLYGKKVGIHGFGNVARDLIRLLEPFQVACMAFSENVPPDYMKEKGAVPCPDLKQLFRENDIVVECEGLTPRTTGSVTEEHLRLMPPDAVFINVGRGAVVEEAALGRVAQEGRIRVAADVFQTEPLPENSPLQNLENVIISPHIAGPTGDMYPRCGELALKNIARYLAGQPLEGIVTLEIYDRST